MDNFIESLGLPLQFVKERDNVKISKFDSSDLFAKIYAKLDKLDFIKLNNEVSDMSLYLDTFRWESESGKFLITLKADFEQDNYSCTVEEVM